MEQGLQVRNICGVDCYENNGVAWLKLENVARGLGFTRIAESGNEVIRWDRVCKYISEMGYSMPTSGHEKLTELGKDGYIPENIFYRLAMKAKNETAEKFQALVADEIIPTIRKTGGYVSNEDLFLNTYLPYADDGTKKLFSATLSALRSANQKIEADKPKVLFADAVSVTKSDITVGELSKLLKQNGINVGRNRLFEILRSNGFLIREKGKDRSLPTQRSMELGLFRVKESTIHANGEVLLSRTPYVTGKGITYFIDKFLNGALRA